MAYQDINKRLRECKKCGEIKSFDEFTKAGSKIGISWLCKKCHAEIEKERYRNNIKLSKSKIEQINNDNKKIRKCKICGVVKSFDDFKKNKACKYGITGMCTECSNKYESELRKNNPEKRRATHQRYLEKNRDKVNSRRKKYYEENKDKIKKRDKEYKTKNKDRIKEYRISYYEKNKTELNQKKKKYRKNNKSKISKYNKEYRKNNIDHITERQSKQRKNNRKNINKVRRDKYQNDLNYKISSNLRSRLRTALKEQNTEKNNKTLDYLGCSITEFKEYIEKQFVDGMSWDNYSYDTWHLDHRFPLSKANLNNEDEIKRVMHYSNFQPLFAFDNISKSNKLNWKPK